MYVVRHVHVANQTYIHTYVHVVHVGLVMRGIGSPEQHVLLSTRADRQPKLPWDRFPTQQCLKDIGMVGLVLT